MNCIIMLYILYRYTLFIIYITKTDNKNVIIFIKSLWNIRVAAQVSLGKEMS